MRTTFIQSKAPNRPAVQKLTPRTARRHALAGLAALGASAMIGNGEAQSTWPSRRISIVVPFPPGGASDRSARALAELLAKDLGQPVVVENKAGAGGIVGTRMVAQSEDAHTFLMGSTSMTIHPSLRTDLGYEVLRDLLPVGKVSAQPLVLSVAADSPLRTLDDVVAKGRAGDELTAGNSGNGSLSHLTTELFNIRMKTRIRPVAYKGESALTPDIVSGVTAMGFLNLPSAKPLLAAGRLRALAVTSDAPVASLPGVPTFASIGLKDFVIEGWAALYATKHVPAAGIERIDAALRKALTSPEIAGQFEAFGVAPTASTSRELDAYTRAEITRWQEVIRSRGIKLE